MINNTKNRHFGLYGACSTMGEALTLGAMTIDGGFASTVCALTSSHFCSSERQYRFPLEYGGQRTPTAQEQILQCIVTENAEVARDD